jgi:hypothetical protein
MSLRDFFLNAMGVRIENRPAMPDIPKYEGTVAIGRLFDAEAARHDIEHKVKMGSVFRLPNNDRGLGPQDGVRRGGRVAESDDWLY